METGLFGNAKELIVMIPIPVSILATAFTLSYFVYVLRKNADAEMLKIRKHIMLLLLAWIGAAMLAGFFVSSGILESTKDLSVIGGLGLGLRLGLILIPVGFLVLCLPLIIWMSLSSSQR
jgi:hypothetical protein